MNLLNIKWRQLSGINKVRFINTMYIWIFLVPVIARLFEKVEESAEVTIFQHTFSAQLTLPFSWIVFYFSALSFAIANLIYQIRCPGIVKDHADYADFRQANKGVEHLDQYLFEVDMNWEGLRQQIEKQDEYFHEIHDVSNPVADDGLLRRRFWTIFDQGDEFRKASRIGAFLFYVVGFLLISFVCVQNIVFVITYLFKYSA